MKLNRYLIIELLFDAAIVAVVVFAVMAMSGCGSIFYGPNGQPTARIYGDYTYSRSAAGAVTITLKHSPVIRAGGIATTQAIGAAGTAASAAILARW